MSTFQNRGVIDAYVIVTVTRVHTVTTSLAAPPRAFLRLHWNRKIGRVDTAIETADHYALVPHWSRFPMHLVATSPA